MSATVTAKPPLAPNLDLQPGDILLHLIVTLLAPMFLAVCCGNLDFARMAALETVNAYRARSHVDLIAVAQIVAHGLASVSSACLSMSDDISLPMTLRLRASANASDRACERNRRALEKNRATPRPDPMFAPDPEPEPGADLTPDPEADRNVAEVSARLTAVRRQAEPPRPPSAAPSRRSADARRAGHRRAGHRRDRRPGTGPRRRISSRYPNPGRPNPSHRDPGRPNPSHRDPGHRDPGRPNPNHCDPSHRDPAPNNPAPDTPGPHKRRTHKRRTHRRRTHRAAIPAALGRRDDRRRQ